MNENSETIDKIILGHAVTNERQKVAMVISRVFEHPSFDGASTTAQNVADRILVLAEAGKLESTGNLRRWRESTVRLKKA
jgi:hypothetical protein